MDFQPLSPSHRTVVMEIFNYYVENSFAAYPQQKLPEAFFDEFLHSTKGFPAYVLVKDHEVAGFGFLRPYKPFSTFWETAEITYFIHPERVGQGLGKKLLHKLEEDALGLGIGALFASIVSENQASILFHQKNGFEQVGRLPAIGKKFGKPFDILWMKKSL